jgi:membrane associated rhomboid family serine protease
MSPRRHRGRIYFALVAVLLILSLFVLHGVAAGVAAFAAMLGFILACIAALRREDADARRKADRTGLAGWFGGWF